MLNNWFWRGGVGFFGLSFIAWMIGSPLDGEPHQLIAVKSQRVAQADTAGVTEVVSDPTATTMAVDYVDPALTGPTGLFEDVGDSYLPEITNGETLFDVHLGDPTLSVDAIGQDLQEIHVGNPEIYVESPNRW